MLALCKVLLKGCPFLYSAIIIIQILRYLVLTFVHISNVVLLQGNVASQVDLGHLAASTEYPSKSSRVYPKHL